MLDKTVCHVSFSFDGTVCANESDKKSLVKQKNKVAVFQLW